MRLIIIICLFITVLGCQTKKQNKAQVTLSKVDFVKVKGKNQLKNKMFNADSLLCNLQTINLPYSSKDIVSKVKYYDSFGGYFIDTTFSKIDVHKSFIYADIKKPIQIFNGDTLRMDFLNQKSNTVVKDDVIFAYQNNNDYNYNIKSQILFPVFKKELEKINLIGSYSQYFGENGIPGVFFILTSFDKTGKQIDYLIVFNRFAWENGLEIDFKIRKNLIIQLDRKEIEYFDEDLENELNQPQMTNKLENYIITEKGIFERMEKVN